MSSTTPGYTEDAQAAKTQYTPTAEETKIFLECNRESFWYRSLPLAVCCMTTTNFLISKGILTTRTRFGSLPKVFASGVFGYMLGKVLYMDQCRKKFLRLENSPLGERFRKNQGFPSGSEIKSELSDPDKQSFDMYQHTDAPSQMPTYNSDYGYGLSSESPVQMGRADDYNTPVQSYMEEEEPKRKGILYEDLRLKNRENYEVTLTQKAETLMKTLPEEQPKTPKKKEAKNIYGDTWEE